MFTNVNLKAAEAQETIPDTKNFNNDVKGSITNVTTQVIDILSIIFIAGLTVSIIITALNAIAKRNIILGIVAILSTLFLAGVVAFALSNKFIFVQFFK